MFVPYKNPCCVLCKELVLRCNNLYPMELFTLRLTLFLVLCPETFDFVLLCCDGLDTGCYTQQKTRLISACDCILLFVCPGHALIIAHCQNLQLFSWGQCRRDLSRGPPLHYPQMGAVLKRKDRVLF